MTQQYLKKKKTVKKKNWTLNTERKETHGKTCFYVIKTKRQISSGYTTMDFIFLSKIDSELPLPLRRWVLWKHKLCSEQVKTTWNTTRSLFPPESSHFVAHVQSPVTQRHKSDSWGTPACWLQLRDASFTHRITGLMYYYGNRDSSKQQGGSCMSMLPASSPTISAKRSHMYMFVSWFQEHWRMWRAWSW